MGFAFKQTNNLFDKKANVFAKCLTTNRIKCVDEQNQIRKEQFLSLRLALRSKNKISNSTSNSNNTSNSDSDKGSSKPQGVYFPSLFSNKNIKQENDSITDGLSDNLSVTERAH